MPEDLLISLEGINMRPLHDAARKLSITGQALKSWSDRRSAHTHGSLRSFRGTYEDDPNQDCQHQHLDFDAGLVSRRPHSRFDEKKGTIVVNPGKEGVVDFLPHVVHPVSGRQIPTTRISGGAWVAMGKGRSPGTDVPMYHDDSIEIGVDPETGLRAFLREDARALVEYREARASGVGPVLDETGWKRAYYQRHDENRSENHTTHLRERSGE